MKPNNITKAAGNLRGIGEQARSHASLSNAVLLHVPVSFPVGPGGNILYREA